MKQTITTIVVLAVSYGLPLIGAPELMVHWKMLVVIAAAAVMLITQPSFSFQDAGGQRGTDRLSMVAILVAGVLGQLIPVFEWAYHGSPNDGTGYHLATAAGLAMMVGGLAFRVWSIRYLGRFFTATVRIVEGHRLVTSGPYAIVRHPSYLGAYVAMVGSAVFLNALIGTAAACVLMAAAYRWRIAVEEEVLGKSFGSAYIDYTKRTPLILPRFLPRTRRVKLLIKLATYIGFLALVGFGVYLGSNLTWRPDERILDYIEIHSQL